MTLKWFASRTVRRAHHAARHVHKLVQHQRDLLSADAIAAVNADIEKVHGTCATGTKAEITKSVSDLEKTTNKWLKPYPNAAWRENIEVILVAVAVAMAIRTFFLQPFKIPTGSMQPTLYGVTYENLIAQPGVKVPNTIQGFFQYWYKGVSYFTLTAKTDGILRYEPPKRFVLFNLWQNYSIGGARGKIWFPPDQLFERANLPQGIPINAGTTFLQMRTIAGDHLFVDRVTYNFRQPSRGDIIVFETHGITALPPDQQDTYYIKRLVALGGEKVRIGDDRHLVINGKRLDAATPHFEFVYSFATNQPPSDSEYSGHVNESVAQNYRRSFGQLAPLFLDEKSELTIPPKHYLAMGDNTMNSSDGRTWGTFPQERVIGKSFFVYWPIGGAEFRGKERESRFGWAHR
jgi:signal peptidase I